MLEKSPSPQRIKRSHRPFRFRQPIDPIPFTRPSLGLAERAALLNALDSSDIGGNGPLGQRLERLIESRFEVRRALLTTSCSHALEMAAMLLNLQPDDEVIMPSFGFVTAATSIVREGGRPVFAEIDPATYNLDPQDVAERITPRTRAIVCVHYAGHACDMDALQALTTAHNLILIEDAAQAVGARFNGRFLGTLGDIGCYSLHATKNITCGEGGVFLTNSQLLAEQAEIMREKGTDRSRFLRGEVDKYTWVAEGSSFVLSDLLAGLALSQFQRLEEITQRRQRVWQRYRNELAELGASGEIALPTIDSRAEPNWHIFPLQVRDSTRRDAVLQALRQRGINATFHFVPLHSSPFSQKRWGYRPGDLPITERVSASLIRLPLYPDLTWPQQAFIIDSLYEIFEIT